MPMLHRRTGGDNVHYRVTDTHPSPGKQMWLKRNPWFERDLLPVLRQKVSEALA